MPPLRCELELHCSSATSRGACASATLLGTPPLGDMMKMQVRTEQTRVGKRTRAVQRTSLRGEEEL